MHSALHKTKEQNIISYFKFSGFEQITYQSAFWKHFGRFAGLLNICVLTSVSCYFAIKSF